MHRVGLLGGTFDPIHYGHLTLAKEALKQFNLDKVIFIPAALPPHKLDRDITPYYHRLNMVKLATGKNDAYEVSELESQRSGPSYSIDTVRFLLQGLPSNTEIFFITGADTILDIPTWKNYQDLLGLCYFIAATRPGYSLDEINTVLCNLPPELKQRILPMAIPLLDISSTAIRAGIKEEIALSAFIPKEVRKYINEYNLYTK